MDLFTFKIVLWVLIACDLLWIDDIVWERWKGQLAAGVTRAQVQQRIKLAETWFNQLLNQMTAGRHRYVHLVLDPRGDAVRAIRYIDPDEEALKNTEDQRDPSDAFILSRLSHAQPLYWTMDFDASSAVDFIPLLPMELRDTLVRVMIDRFGETNVAGFTREGSLEERSLRPDKQLNDVEVYGCFRYRHDRLRSVNIRFTYLEKPEANPQTAPSVQRDEMTLEKDPEHWLTNLIELAVQKRFHVAEIRTRDHEQEIRGIANCCNDDSHGAVVDSLDRRSEQALIDLLLRKTGHHPESTYHVWGSFGQIVGDKIVTVEVYDHRDITKWDRHLHKRPGFDLLVTTADKPETKLTG